MAKFERMQDGEFHRKIKGFCKGAEEEGRVQKFKEGGMAEFAKKPRPGDKGQSQFSKKPLKLKAKGGGQPQEEHHNFGSFVGNLGKGLLHVGTLGALGGGGHGFLNSLGDALGGARRKIASAVVPALSGGALSGDMALNEGGAVKKRGGSCKSMGGNIRPALPATSKSIGGNIRPAVKTMPSESKFAAGGVGKLRHNQLK